ncbi:ras-related protein RABF2b [Orussus abietinus]|uniref:ras-related protein RABF2b n=1 Tax=Orussus abietinus TaxID=222816 RepID=UPI00062613E1|nr:ras-related protein RABF2b [Orussus abietinus]
MRTIEAKVVVLGSQGVGKTSVVTRYVQKVFNHQVNPTIGASFFTCKMYLEETRIKLQVWDTAGQERFRSMAPMFYRNASAALLVFDLTDAKSFDAIQTWVNELKRNVDEAMVLAVVGNKSDLFKERKVSSDEGWNYSMKIGATYHETSALHDEGVEQVFLTIALGIIRLSSGNIDLTTSLRVYDSTSSGLSSPGLPLSPSSEESFANTSIAHAIHEKSWACC